MELAKAYKAPSKSDCEFEDHFLENRANVYNQMLKILKDPQLAEDATQNAFLCHWRFRDSWRKDCKISSWLYVIAKRCALMSIREHKRPAQQIILTAANLEDFQTALDLEIDWNETQERLDRAIDAKSKLKVAAGIIETLPAYCIEIFKLVYVGELTAREASKMIGVPLNAGKSRLQRARSEMRRKWRNHWRQVAREQNEALKSPIDCTRT